MRISAAAPTEYDIRLIQGGARGPFRIEAELCYQPIGYRWAMNLKNYDADEPRRFTAYYEAASSSSMQILAQARAAQ